MTHQPYAVAIVLAFNRFAHTTQPCLQTLLPQAQQTSTPTLVFDNHSHDGSSLALTEHLQTAQLPSVYGHTNAHNTGYGGGMNDAVGHCKAALGLKPRWWLLINNDTLFPAGALQQWLAALQAADTPSTSADRQIGVLSPSTNNAGNVQRLIHPCDDYEQFCVTAKQLMGQPVQAFQITQRADFFCTAIRSEVWDLLQGFDRFYERGYYEDFDFCVRVAKEGYASAFTENSLVYHQGSASFKLAPDVKTLMRANEQRFRARHPHVHAPHVRSENWAQIWHYLSHPDIQSTAGLQARLKLRIQSATTDQPKSPHKKIMNQLRFWRLSRELKRLGLRHL